MTRIVIFDLGGVLLPFNRQRRVGAMVTALGLASTDVMRFLRSGVTEELDRGECDLEASAARMSAYAKRPVTVAEAKQLWLSVFEEPNVELWNAVAQLRGYARTYALSDNPAFVSEMFPRKDAFDQIFWSAELGLTKPAREVFARVSQEVRAAPANITFVDDSAANVEAARAFGWDGIVFSSNAQVLADLRTRGFQM